MTLLYEQELDKDNIIKISQQEHFPNKGFIEKFIMDFEILHHVNKLMDCKVRGGMSMPFHLDQNIRRLSVDIDILVNLSFDDVRKKISQINLTSDDIIFVENKNFEGNLPMMRFDITHKTNFSPVGHVNLDIFCENIPELESKTFGKGIDILGFKTKEDIEIFDVGSLIADKLNTIAIGTIGYTIKIPERTPKQIYDLGRLFDSWIENSLNRPYEKFESFSTYKSSKHAESFSFKEVVESISKHTESLVNPQNINSLESTSKNKHGDFKGQYLDTGGYNVTQYIEDIFKVRLFCKNVLDTINGIYSKSDCIDKFANHLTSLKQFQDFNVIEQRTKRLELINSFSKHTHLNTKAFKVVPLPSLYLIHQIETT